MSKNKNKKGLKKKNIRKLILCVLFVAAIISGYFVYDKFFKKSSTPEAPKVVDEIKTFNYVVNENDSKLFKSTFDELKKVLNENPVDEKKYAETISKLFIIDFFTFSNKSSKNDVGGVQFIISSYKKDFVDYARDGIYKQVKNSIDGDGNKDLPTVKSVNVSSVEEITPSDIFTGVDFGENNKGYQVTLDWTYESDSDFQTKAVLTIVKEENRLTIAKMEKN